MQQRRSWPALFLLFFLLPTVHAQDIEFKASVNADRLGLDDILIYTLTFKGIENPGEPEVNHLSGVRIAQTSRSSEFKFINGVTSHYTNFIYYLIPGETGELILPPATFEHGGKTFKTQSFRIKVVEGSVLPQSRSKSGRRSPFDDDFFDMPFSRNDNQPIEIKLEVDLSKRNVFVGEQFIYRILLYTQNRIESFNLLSNQSISGFWQEWYPSQRTINGRTVQVNGKEYQVFEIGKVALFASEAGTKKIPSLKYELTIAADIFSMLSSGRRVYRTTPETSVEVLPLPAGAENLSVGVFDFSINETSGEVDINDLVSIQITLEGSGNSKTVELPQFQSNDLFKVYPAKISHDLDYDGTELIGTVTAEIPVSFNKPGLVSFPSLSFSHFNPRLQRIVTLTSKPISITVVGSKRDSGVIPASVPGAEVERKGEDIAYIRRGGISDQLNVFYRSNWFVTLLIVPLMLLALYTIKLFIFDRFVASRLKQSRAGLNQAVRAIKSARGYGDLQPVVEKFLQKKTGLGLSQLNDKRVLEILQDTRLTEAELKTFIRIKSDAESARFSPLIKGETEFKQDLSELIKVLRRLDTLLK